MFAAVQPQPTAPFRILLVEDDRADRFILENFFEENPLSFEVETAGSKSEALNSLKTSQFDAVVLDYLLGDGTGIEVLPKTGETPVIFITGAGNETVAVNAMKLGAFDYLVKDSELNYLKDLKASIESALQVQPGMGESKKYPEGRLEKRILIPSIALTLWILLIDISTPLGVAAGVPYVGLVMVGLWSSWRRFFFAAAGVGTILTLLGMILSPEGGTLWMVDVNRFLAILVIWVTAFLCHTRKKYEFELEFAHEHVKSVMNSVLDSIVTINEGGIIESVNPATERLFGYSPKEIVKRNVKILMPDPYQAGHDGYVRNYLETNKPKIIGIGQREVLGKRKDGSVFPLELGVSETRVGTRRIFVGILRDISERKRIENRRAEREDRLKRQNQQLVELACNEAFFKGDLDETVMMILEISAQILDTERVGIWLFDEDGDRANCVGLFQKSSGTHSWGPDLSFENYPKYFRSLEEGRILVISKAQTDTRTDELLEDYLFPLGITSLLDAPIRVKGSLVGVICHENVGPEREWSTEDQQFAASMADFLSLAIISNERRKAEMALKESEEKFRSLVEYAADGIFLHDHEGKILDVNRSACEALGYSREELIGLSVAAIDKLYSPGQLKNQWNILDPEKLLKLEGVHQRKDGSTFPVEVHIRLLGTKYPRLFVALVRDITNRKNNEKKLKEAKEEAEKATQLKDKFVSLVSHDLRAPFNVIQGLLMLMEDDTENPLSEYQKEHIQIILGVCTNMLQMIGELLDISRLKTGKIQLNRSFLGGRLIAGSIVDNFENLARQKGIEISNEVPENFRIYGDLELVFEVFQNLVSNAIKFCKEGDRITLFTPSGQKSTIAVRDTGRGIPEIILPKLFRFEERTTSEGTSGEKGTGLGLPFCHEIMETHGGTLRVESEVGKGSTFYVEFPHIRPTILIIDESTEERSRIKDFLEHLDVEFLEAENGKIALELLDGYCPHLIITEYNVPILNGLEILEKVRGNPKTKSIPVFMITSNQDKELKKLAFGKGVQDFDTKPVDQEAFSSRVKKFFY